MLEHLRTNCWKLSLLALLGLISLGTPSGQVYAQDEAVAVEAAPVAEEATRTFRVELEVDNSDGALRIGGTAELRIPAETVLAHRISPSLLTLDDAGNIGVKIVDDAGRVEFVVADIAHSSNDGVWLTGLPETATIITVGQGYVASGAVVDAVAESDIPTAVAIKDEQDTD